MHSPRFSGALARPKACPSALWREDDAEQNPLVAAYLSWGADVSTPVGRDDVVNLVIRNWHPFAVHFDLVVVTDHATLGGATIY